MEFIREGIPRGTYMYQRPSPSCSFRYRELGVSVSGRAERFRSARIEILDPRLGWLIWVSRLNDCSGLFGRPATENGDVWGSVCARGRIGRSVSERSLIRCFLFAFRWKEVIWRTLSADYLLLSLLLWLCCKRGTARGGNEWQSLRMYRVSVMT